MTETIYITAPKTKSIYISELSEQVTKCKIVKIGAVTLIVSYFDIFGATANLSIRPASPKIVQPVPKIDGISL